MNKISLCILALGAAPLAAQTWEAGLFIGRQKYEPVVISVPGVASARIKVDDRSVLGLRLGYSVLDLGAARLQATVAFQPPVTSSGTLGVRSSLDEASAAGDYKQSSFAVGAMFNFKTPVALGVGLDYRVEKLEAEGSSTNYGRAWLRASAGMVFPMPTFSPFVGLEFTAPLTTTSDLRNPSEEELLKAAAPKAQIGIYGGIRF
jgi:hypothetical protein